MTPVPTSPPKPTPTPKTVAEIRAEWPDSPHLDHTHMAAGLECESCHIAWPPEGAPDAEVCLACHGDSYRGLTKLTQDQTPNPHDWHMGQVSCSLCHRVHAPLHNPCQLCH